METKTAAPAAAAAPEAGVETGRQVEIRAPKVERLIVESDVLVLDTGMFDHMTRIAKLMASSSLVPAHLNSVRTVGGNEVSIEPAEAVANCFLVVNQALRWRMDPFAVAQGVYVTKGRLGYEGKLIAAVINAHPAIERRLSYTYEGTGEKRKITVSAKLKGEQEPRTVDGTVEQWKTSGAGSPWGKNSQWDQQLSYRGAREWARRHMPEAILGVLGDDELEQFSTTGGRLEDTAAGTAAGADRSGASRLKAAVAAGAKNNAEDAEVLSETAKGGEANGAAGAPGAAPASAPAAEAPAAAAAAEPKPAPAPAASEAPKPAAAEPASKGPEEASQKPKPAVVTQPQPAPKKGETGTPELKARFLSAFATNEDMEILNMKRDEVNLFVWTSKDLEEMNAAYKKRLGEIDK